MSAADELDNELLGLVGDSDSDDGNDFDRLDQTEANDDRSPSAEPHQSVEKVDEAPTRTKGVAQKVKAKRGPRKARQESEDEDDAASPSPEADDASAMGASDGEADAPGEDEDDDGPLFPVEGKFMSSTDREHVLGLPELDREEILADRAQQVIKRQQDLQLKKALASSSAAASKAKRKATTADLEDNNRRTTRPRTEKVSALDQYKRAREQKGQERDRFTSARDRRDDRRSSSTAGSDRDADGESEVEWAEPERKDEPPAEIRDFDRCRLGRTAFTRVCFYPGFEDTIKGCFARVNIGLNRETGQNVYRMTQIKGFTEGKPYNMETSGGKKLMTDQYALVTEGASEKPWPFSACSDGRFTEVEFNRYADTLKKENMREPSRKFLLKKLGDINTLLEFKFTEETLQQKFAKQRAIERKHDPVQQAKQKRKAVEERRAEAVENMDEDEIARCDAELEALENGAVNGHSVKVKSSPTKPMSQHERLAQLNHVNRHKNQQEVRRALIEERKRVLKAREAEREKKTAEIRAKVHAQAAARRKSNVELFGEEGTDTSRAATPMSGVDTPKKRSGTPLAVAIAAKGPIGALKKKNMDDDVISSMDLGIDIDI